MNVFKTDEHDNPTHYECTTVLGNKAIVYIEYDYSNPKKVDAHIYRMVFPGKGCELLSPRKWNDFGSTDPVKFRTYMTPTVEGDADGRY